VLSRHMVEPGHGAHSTITGLRGQESVESRGYVDPQQVWVFAAPPWVAAN